MPAKALGQHFLIDRRIVERIVAATGVTGAELVVEVGPGTGVLTDRLAGLARRLVAIELDRELAARLRERYAAMGHVEVLQADVLSVDPSSLFAGEDPDATYGLVGNLPYNIGTAVLRHFLESRRPPAWVVAMLQREVADAVAARPGAMSLVSVGVQVYAEARRLFSVPPSAFYPPPKVYSAVVRLDLRAAPLVPEEERERFFEVVRAGFSAPRKQIRNSLANGLGVSPVVAGAAIEAAGLSIRARPQDLTVEDWLRLSRSIGN